jgi:hypothetical protein
LTILNPNSRVKTRNRREVDRKNQVYPRNYLIANLEIINLNHRSMATRPLGHNRGQVVIVQDMVSKEIILMKLIHHHHTRRMSKYPLRKRRRNIIEDLEALSARAPTTLAVFSKALTLNSVRMVNTSILKTSLRMIMGTMGTMTIKCMRVATGRS